MSQREQVIQDFRTLLSHQTITIDPKNISPTPEQLQPFQDTMAYLKQRAQEEGEKRGKPFHITELESNGRPMLIIGTHDTKTPDVAILTHIDTVEPKKSEREGERSEQLKLRLKIVDREERAYGRGTYDMKYAAVAGLGILADLPKEDDGLSVSLMFTSDEEKGAKNGAQVLYNEGYKPKFLIVPSENGEWIINPQKKSSRRKASNNLNNTASVVATVVGGDPNGPNEWISVKSLQTLIFTLREFIHKKAESHKTRR